MNSSHQHYLIEYETTRLFQPQKQMEYYQLKFCQKVTVQTVQKAVKKYQNSQMVKLLINASIED